MNACPRSLPVDLPRWWSCAAKRAVRWVKPRLARELILDLDMHDAFTERWALFTIEDALGAMRAETDCQLFHGLAAYSVLALIANPAARRAACQAMREALVKRRGGRGCKGR